MTWWTRNNLRLIQNNLRETDANLDVDLLMTQLKKLSANVLMLNAGGIAAFYPTKLDYHYRAAHQRKDLLREAIEKAHANDMKFIARFDFSKAHETIYERQPEWFYRTRSGEAVNYRGIVHTCVNGYYQQEYSLKIIDEVLSHYDVDGIFFNMFGYQTWDYSGNEYGICHCDNCRTRFRDMYALDLPIHDSMDDPVYRKYREFQETTTKEMLDRIYRLVKSKKKEIAISTYDEHKVDIVRKESNTDKRRTAPAWLYSGSENVQSLEDSWEDKLVSNCCINAIDLVHRFTGVTRHEVNLRLKQGLANGSGLDFCIIGVFDDYPDRENLPVVEQIFGYHKQYEAYYGQFTTMADAALIKPGKLHQKDRKEYSGLYKMLKEAHILFDAVDQSTLPDNRSKLERYKTVIIPDIRYFSDGELNVLEEISRKGVQLFATGMSFTVEGNNRIFLQRQFGVELDGIYEHHRESAYLFAGRKDIWKRMADRDWIFVDGPFMKLRYAEQAETLLDYIYPSTYGPPERASGHRISKELFGASLYPKDRQNQVCLPWKAGELYLKHGYAFHKDIVLDLLEHSNPAPWRLWTNAPVNVEATLHKLSDQTYILHLINLSGCNGVSYFEPNPVYGIRIELRDAGAVKELENLSGQFAMVDGQDKPGAVLTLNELHDFAAVVIRTEVDES